MLLLSDLKVAYRIASPDSLTVIGSDSLNAQGNLYSIEINAITKPINKRLKRTFDLLLSIFLLSIIPLTLILVKNRLKFIYNIFCVLVSSKSWVGYSTFNGNGFSNLPKIKNGIVSSADYYPTKKLTKELVERLNINYAKDYKILSDLLIVYKSFSKLGN
jgi:lipopolysaccharide/colanic/teichoic acid biosynthesis glycosyltransferase